jgi:hypothetical protein
MGTSMAFTVAAVGYGATLSRVILGLNRDGQLQVYASALSGTAGLLCELTTSGSFYIPEKGMPPDIDNYSLQFTLKGPMLSKGNGAAPVNFALFSETEDKALYEFDRRPLLYGCALSSIEGTGRIERWHMQETLEGGTYWKHTANVEPILRIIKQLGFDAKQVRF